MAADLDYGTRHGPDQFVERHRRFERIPDLSDSAGLGCEDRSRPAGQRVRVLRQRQWRADRCQGGGGRLADRGVTPCCSCMRSGLGHVVQQHAAPGGNGAREQAHAPYRQQHQQQERTQQHAADVDGGDRFVNDDVRGSLVLPDPGGLLVGRLFDCWCVRLAGSQAWVRSFARMRQVTVSG